MEDAEMPRLLLWQNKESVRQRDELVLCVRGELWHAGLALVLLAPHVDEQVTLRSDHVENLSWAQVTFDHATQCNAATESATEEHFVYDARLQI